MTPADIGLPAKFVSFYPGQEDEIAAIAASDKRFTLLSAPPGSGKTVIYTAVSRILNARTLVLTVTKGLQAQVLTDFAPIGLTDVRGQNNYECVAVRPGGQLADYANPGLSCDHGPCHVGMTCASKAAGCLYYDAVRRAAKAQFVVTNYRYWMTANRYAEPDVLGRFDLLILDEAHNAPDELSDFCSVRLNRADVRSLLDMPMPVIGEDRASWVEWAQQALKVCRERYAKVRTELGTINRRTAAQKMKRLTELGHGLRELASAHEWRRAEPSRPTVDIPGAATDWVAETTEQGALFSPVWAHAYAEEYIFKNIPRVLLVSGTLQAAVTRYLGIQPDAYDYREVSSTFDPRRRPLIYTPTTTVDRHMTEGQVRQWVNKIDRIIDGRLDRKGVIHTRSYDRARVIVARSKHAAIMVSHGSRDARFQIERFMRMRAPAVLVSPSVEEGWDFHGDTCRYQIIAKVPFVDTRSLVIQARAKSDKQYLNYLTALSVIQMSGRGMRSQADWCETIIVDDHWSWFKQAANGKKMWPYWFKKAMHTVDGIPAALAL